MAMCDEFPEFYFEDSNGKMPWDYPSWSDDGLEDEHEDEDFIFDSFIEAKEFCLNNLDKKPRITICQFDRTKYNVELN